MQCPRCKGSGRIRNDVPSGIGSEPLYDDCPDCKGTGQLAPDIPPDNLDVVQTQAFRYLVAIVGQVSNSDKLSFWIWIKESAEARIEFEKSLSS